MRRAFAVDTEAFVQGVFKSDSNVRYVAIVNNDFRLLVSRQRPGIASLTSEETEHNFMSIMPPIIVDAVEKLQPFLGLMQVLAVRYEQVLLMFHRVGNMVVVISFQSEVTTPFITKANEEFEKLSKQHLAQ